MPFTIIAAVDRVIERHDGVVDSWPISHRELHTFLEAAPRATRNRCRAPPGTGAARPWELAPRAPREPGPRAPGTGGARPREPAPRAPKNRRRAPPGTGAARSREFLFKPRQGQVLGQHPLANLTTENNCATSTSCCDKACLLVVPTLPHHPFRLEATSEYQPSPLLCECHCLAKQVARAERQATTACLAWLVASECAACNHYPHLC